MSKDKRTPQLQIILHTSGQGSYHDHFARVTISGLEIMKDLLRYYIQKAIVKFLRTRFGNVPDDIILSLGKMNDPIALESPAEHAATCTSFKDFADLL